VTGRIVAGSLPEYNADLSIGIAVSTPYSS
jgi:hypothetical protein